MRYLITSFYLLFLTLIATSALASAPFEAGRDYLVLPSNASALRETAKDKVKVVEFFSYGCPACFKLEPHLEKWLTHKPSHVYFKRIPVLFQPDWNTYAKYYFALENMGLHYSRIHQAIFNALQVQNLDLTQLQIMESFLSGQSINQKEFLNAYRSVHIDIELAEAKKSAADAMVFQVPAIIVDGKYKVDPSLSGADYNRLFKIVNYLIHLSHQEKNKS